MQTTVLKIVLRRLHHPSLWFQNHSDCDSNSDSNHTNDASSSYNGINNNHGCIGRTSGSNRRNSGLGEGSKNNTDGGGSGKAVVLRAATMPLVAREMGAVAEATNPQLQRPRQLGRWPNYSTRVNPCLPSLPRRLGAQAATRLVVLQRQTTPRPVSHKSRCCGQELLCVRRTEGQSARGGMGKRRCRVALVCVCHGCCFGVVG
jgi:hypothetical protein